MKKDLASRLTDRIIIESKVATPDDMGGREVRWQEHKATWAQIIPIATEGKELFRNQQIEAPTTYIAIIRYMPDIDPTMRIIWDHDIYQIRSIIKNGMHREELKVVMVG